MPTYSTRAPDERELRAREREMHEAQMREEARQRELEQREAAAPVQSEPERPQQRIEPAHIEPARIEPARIEPAPQPRPEPRADPREVLQSAGLQMVETRADRAPAVPPEAEPVVLGRPRRERARTEETAAQPLVQVETKN